MKKGEDASFTRDIWEFLASIRLTVVVLLSLAATSVIGTLIPQNASHADYLRTYGEFLYRIFYALDIFDMYHSWWFRFLVIMLAGNIIVCSVDRLTSLWKVIFVKTPSFRLSTFQKLKNREAFAHSYPAERLRPAYEAFMGKRFAYTRTEPTETGFCIFAEKGRWTRLGVYIVHLSVVLLLIGGLIGSIFGFEGYVNVPEGDAVSSIRLRNNNQMRSLDFEIRCDDFEVSFYDSGAPKEFRSSLVLLEDGKEVYKKDIIVNDPIRYGGINIFQSSYGTVPLDIRAVQSEGITLSVTSKDTGMVYTLKAFLGKPADLPEGGGTFTLTNFTPSFRFMGQRDLGAAFVGKVMPPQGEPKEVNLPVRFPRFDKMRRDSSFVISVSGYAQRYYTGLQVTRDPGVLTVYAGFLLMIIGCFVTFFMSHQQVCAEVVTEGNKTRVILTGKANKNPVGMAQKIREMARRLPDLPTSGEGAGRG